MNLNEKFDYDLNFALCLQKPLLLGRHFQKERLRLKKCQITALYLADSQHDGFILPNELYYKFLTIFTIRVTLA